MALFEIGDTITIRPSGRAQPAEIIGLRYIVGNFRTGEVNPAIDVLREDGKLATYFTHDVARWNPEIVAKLSRKEARHP